MRRRYEQSGSTTVIACVISLLRWENLSSNENPLIIDPSILKDISTGRVSCFYKPTFFMEALGIINGKYKK